MTLHFHNHKLLLWDCKVKRRSLFNRSLGPNQTTVTMDNSLNGSASYAGSFKFGSVMQALKCAKQLVDIGHLKTRAIIAHKVGHLPVYFGDSQFYFGRRVFLGKFRFFGM
jgi:hypothetical protein